MEKYNIVDKDRTPGFDKSASEASSTEPMYKEGKNMFDRADKTRKKQGKGVSRNDDER